LGYDNINGNNACTQYTLDSGTYYIAAADTLGNGITLYSDEGVTLAINGYYSDGINYWLVTSGVLSGQTACGTTTTTTSTTSTTTTEPAPTTSTTTTTTTAPATTTTTTTTTTSTTTTTTTIAQYLVNLYGKTDSTNPPLNDVYLFISTDGGSTYTQQGLVFDGTCSSKYAFTVDSGTSVSVKIGSALDNYITFGRASGTTCPAAGAFCTDTFTVTSATNRAYTAQDGIC
jgi:hypothetical protein